MLVTIIYFIHNVSHSSQPQFFIHIYFVVCKPFEFGPDKILSFGKEAFWKILYFILRNYGEPIWATFCKVTKGTFGKVTQGNICQVPICDMCQGHTGKIWQNHPGDIL